MELISLVFPSGPVKVFDFLLWIFFSFFFFFLHLTPARPPPLTFLSSFLMAAHQELRDNQLAEHPWLPFEDCDYDGGGCLKLLSRNQVDPLVFHCHWLCAVSLPSGFFSSLDFCLFLAWREEAEERIQRMHESSISSRSSVLKSSINLLLMMDDGRELYFSEYFIHRISEGCFCIDWCSQVLSVALN